MSKGMPYTSELGEKYLGAKRRRGNIRKNLPLYRVRNAPEPKRVPLDKCSVPLWRVKSIEVDEKKVPIFRTVDGEKVQRGTRKVVRTFVTIENFRLQPVTFIVCRKLVHDTRDNSKLTRTEFETYVSNKVGSPFSL